MKKLIILVILVVFLYGCGNSVAARQNVADSFDTANVQYVPGSAFSFIVRTDTGEIWYVECSSDTSKIMYQTQLFAATK